MEDHGPRDPAEYMHSLDKAVKNLKEVLSAANLDSSAARKISYALGAIEHSIAVNNINAAFDADKWGNIQRAISSFLPQLVNVFNVLSKKEQKWECSEAGSIREMMETCSAPPDDIQFKGWGCCKCWNKLGILRCTGNPEVKCQFCGHIRCDIDLEAHPNAA